MVASSDGEGPWKQLYREVAADTRTDTLAGPLTPSPRPDPDASLIEDNPDAREMLCQLLEIAGHEVYTAANGASGLELLKTECPDVAIIDIGLPGLDGNQVGRRIREDPRTAARC